MKRLASLLSSINGRGYPAYKSLRGSYRFETFDLDIEKVQGDPFASPSRLSIRIDHATTGIASDFYANPVRRIGAENALNHFFQAACQSHRTKLGSGKSGAIGIDAAGQQMLQRSCIQISQSDTVVRFFAGLPANGRRINGPAAQELLLQRIPQIVDHALLLSEEQIDTMQRYADTNEDATFLRSELARSGLVAFVADHSILPRASGIEDTPLPGAIPFVSPESLAVTFELPHAGSTRGLGVHSGITLIVGGGFHGKSTLLNALEKGVYNHCPGDGRERVVSVADAMKIRAEDGRSIVSVNLHPFISDLPGGASTQRFSSQNASGSTSQAAAISEALECGCSTLLIDEDISATNFLIRDARMQQLISNEQEPITPLSRTIRSLNETRNTSIILVLGGCSDYFETADTVIGMIHYLPQDLTEKAHALCDTPIDNGITYQFPTEKRSVDERCFSSLSASGRKGRFDTRPPKVKARSSNSLVIGNEEIDLSLLPQILDATQAKTIGATIMHAFESGALLEQDLTSALATILDAVRERGWGILGQSDFAEIRLQDAVAALNRWRSLRITP